MRVMKYTAASSLITSIHFKQLYVYSFICEQLDAQLMREHLMAAL